jgi:hypothetical protein
MRPKGASIKPLNFIPGNLAIASNTDILIFRNPLPDNLIGKGLGQWKLEHEFKNGVFVRPRLYCYEDAIIIQMTLLLYAVWAAFAYLAGRLKQAGPIGGNGWRINQKS